MCVCGAYAEFAGEPNNVLKGAKWSPDGLCLMTASEDRTLRLFELPGDDGGGGGDGGGSVAELSSVLQVREGESIYDYAWYPHMDSAQPETCCFASSSRDHPVHLWDAYTGSCRASYVSYNHLDEVVAANSCAFSLDGQRLYCGFDRAVRIFDVTRPGRQCKLLQTCKSRKSRAGQRGIISCFAFAPDFSGLYAAGSFSGTTGLYAEGSDGLIVELGGHNGGVTQCTFSHDGLKLYTAARCDGAIHCWDVRMSCRVLASFQRACPTNQRIGFELKGAASEALITASQDGRVLVYDTTAPAEPPATVLSFGEATNAATSHPNLPLLAVAVGERRFPLSRDDHGARGGGGDSGATTEEAWSCDRASEDDPYANGLSVWRMPTPNAESAQPSTDGLAGNDGSDGWEDGA